MSKIQKTHYKLKYRQNTIRKSIHLFQGNYQ